MAMHVLPPPPNMSRRGNNVAGTSLMRDAVKRLRSIFQVRSPSPSGEAASWLKGVATVLPPLQARLLPSNGMTVTIIGCGRLGRAIAGELLRRGCSVQVFDSVQGEEQITEDLHGTLTTLVASKFLLSHDVPLLMSRFCVATSIEAAVQNAFLVIEAVPESLPLKQELFVEVAKILGRLNVAPERILLCSSSMTLHIKDIAVGLASTDQLALRPYCSRVVGLRFLMPCWFVDEVSVSYLTMVDEPTVVGTANSGQPGPPSAVDTMGAILALLKMRVRTERTRCLTTDEILLYAGRQQSTCARWQEEEATSRVLHVVKGLTASALSVGNSVADLLNDSTAMGGLCRPSDASPSGMSTQASVTEHREDRTDKTRDSACAGANEAGECSCEQTNLMRRAAELAAHQQDALRSAIAYCGNQSLFIEVRWGAFGVHPAWRFQPLPCLMDCL